MIFRWFESESDRELRETNDLINLSNQKLKEFFLSIDDDLASLIKRIIPSELEEVESGWLFEQLSKLARDDGSYTPCDIDISKLNESKRISLREYLRRKLRILNAGLEAYELYEKVLSIFASRLYQNVTVRDEGTLWLKLIDTIPNNHQLLDEFVGVIFNDDAQRFELFYRERKRLEKAVVQGSKLVIPSSHKESNIDRLIDIYFGASPLSSLLHNEVRYQIPSSARKEHTHIIGGSGHGKTELLKSLILDDLIDAYHTSRSVIVIDSQGDLLNSILRLSAFESGTRLSDRLIIIDPTEIDNPPALNLFAFKGEGITALDKERLLGSAIAQYEYLFGELLGAEMTQRQGTMFSFLGRLMITLPNPNIYTLIDVLEHGERYKGYMDKLEGAAGIFFKTRFFEKAFSPVKSQIVNRLFGILGNSTLDRMFSGLEMKLHMGEALKEGKIILINTAKELLKSDGSSFFGRFILSLLSHAILERANLKPDQRNPISLYIDEAQEYLDTVMLELFSQGRKYGLGITIAHQNLDQLDVSLRANLAANTSVKIAGGLSDKDARLMASDMHCDADFLKGMHKSNGDTEFALFVRNSLPRAGAMSFKLGVLNDYEIMDEWQLEKVRERNNELYGRNVVALVTPNVSDQTETVTQAPIAPKPTIQSIEELTIPVATPSPLEPRRVTLAIPRVIEEGKGGKDHKYLQALVKKLGEANGWYAQIEKPIDDGFVDVWLTKNGKSIAVEVALKTKASYEASNIAKCLKAGPDKVIVLSINKAHLEAVKRASSKFINSQSVIFALPADLLPLLLDGHTPSNPKEVKERTALSGESGRRLIRRLV